MKNQSSINKAAWSHRAYEFWQRTTGAPSEAAIGMKKNPKSYLKNHMKLLGDVKGKRIANLLGSNGRRAVPLAILGADVTIVDISEENKRYGLELAEAAGVNINYITSDLMELDISNLMESFDIIYLEGGILHYFSDLKKLADIVYLMLRDKGILLLNDFHPIRKLIAEKDVFIEVDELEVTGDYFDTALISAEVAYKKYFPEEEQVHFPSCLLRYWTMGEIITTFAEAGFVIKALTEEPRLDKHKNLPGEFTLLAEKLSHVK